MSVYLDTSVVVSFFVRDDHAVTVRKWAETEPKVTISDWTATEFTSALSYQVRAGRLSERERRAAELGFDRWMAQRSVLEVERDRFRDARHLMRNHARLRAPDALHLAIARQNGLALATLDQDMREAATAEGMKIIEL